LLFLFCIFNGKLGRGDFLTGRCFLCRFIRAAGQLCMNNRVERFADVYKCLLCFSTFAAYFARFCAASWP
jgi:hypothetical protein